MRSKPMAPAAEQQARRTGRRMQRPLKGRLLPRGSGPPPPVPPPPQPQPLPTGTTTRADATGAGALPTSRRLPQSRPRAAPRAQTEAPLRYPPAPPALPGPLSGPGRHLRPAALQAEAARRRLCLPTAVAGSDHSPGRAGLRRLPAPPRAPAEAGCRRLASAWRAVPRTPAESVGCPCPRAAGGDPPQQAVATLSPSTAAPPAHARPRPVPGLPPSPVCAPRPRPQRGCRRWARWRWPRSDGQG